MRSNKAKEGMTLIEVIISVALLSILIIPLSSLVISSLRNNIDAEDMQKASYIGQKVLEELKAYDEIKLQGDNERYFELLDGDKIVKKSEGEFLGNFNRNIYGSSSETDERDKDIYKVEVEMKKDSNFQYDNINNLDINNADFAFKFLEIDNINKIQIVSETNTNSFEVNNGLIIEIKKTANNLEVKIFNEGNSIPIINVYKSDPVNNKIILNLNSSYKKNTNIEIKNYLDKSVEVYIVKQNNSNGNLKLFSSKGDVILYEENEVEENKIGDMYNHKVIVKDKKNNILFQGSSSNNVNIK